jgi:hypothetical protein
MENLPLSNLSVLVYGQPETGKSTFVKKVKGVEINDLPDFGTDPKLYPSIYVTNIKPEEAILFDIVLEFQENHEVLFIKGFILD